jgi:hypothetical protein
VTARLAHSNSNGWHLYLLNGADMASWWLNETGPQYATAGQSSGYDFIGF